MTSEEIVNWYKETTNELGIDLTTLFKALKNGIYYVTDGTQLTKDYVYLVDNYMNTGTRDKLSYSFMTTLEKKTLLFSDYGKTWFLDKKGMAES